MSLGNHNFNSIDHDDHDHPHHNDNESHSGASTDDQTTYWAWIEKNFHLIIISIVITALLLSPPLGLISLITNTIQVPTLVIAAAFFVSLLSISKGCELLLYWLLSPENDLNLDSRSRSSSLENVAENDSTKLTFERLAALRNQSISAIRKISSDDEDDNLYIPPTITEPNTIIVPTSSNQELNPGIHQNPTI